VRIQTLHGICGFVDEFGCLFVFETATPLNRGPPRSFFFSFFLSWVANTQHNHWTQRMVRIRFMTGARGDEAL